jgi:hypothetical protein
MPIGDDVVDRTSYTSPVPGAQKDPTRIFSEAVADNVVVLDAESMHYHSLNQTAAQVWDLCDGQRSVDDITAELRNRGIDAPEEAVALAVAELGEAELLQTTPTLGESRVHRRRVLKLAAAGLIGAGALPIVQSITVPHAASAATLIGVDCCTQGCTIAGLCVNINVASLGILGCTGSANVCVNGVGVITVQALACVTAACNIG